MLDSSAVRLAIAAAIAVSVGTTLVLSELRWFKRVPLTQRLEPFSGIATRTKRRAAFKGFRDALAPVAFAGGERVAKLFGISDDLATRLTRASYPSDVTSFRFRQFMWSAGALGCATLLALVIHPPLALMMLLLLAAPLLAFLVWEQHLAALSKRRQDSIFTELPVFSEQLAMLLESGYSLGSALNRLAQRGGGAVNHDILLVCERVHHGVTTNQALQEWAQVVAVPELDRLIAVLAVGSQTSDLGRLVSEEARSIRQESQRRLAEFIDRRAQQVWVPITVATLVPGVIFLVIPFLQALQMFSTN